MDAKTAAALEKSIQHWEKNATAETPGEARTGPEACALCGLFFLNRSCSGCPVSAQTEISGCRKTPYENTAIAYAAWIDADLGHLTYNDRRALFHEAARAELAFLISLREPPQA